MTRCLLALGSNLGDRHSILAKACAEVADLQGVQLLARSRWYETVPIGGAEGQGNFLNGAILLETSLLPQPLVSALLAIETHLGRQRVARWDARRVDIDILLYGTKIVETKDLTVPHPRMAFRRFVLEPAAEIAGPMLHPTSGWTLARLWAHAQSAPRQVVVTATEKPIADWLASQLREALGCKLPQTASTIVSQPGVAKHANGIKSLSGEPPVVATCSPSALVDLAAMRLSQKNGLSPALVIAIDVNQPRLLRAAAKSAGFTAENKPCETAPRGWLNSPGLGPLARLTSEDPATMIQESVAALRCLWPDLQ